MNQVNLLLIRIIMIIDKQIEDYADVVKIWERVFLEDGVREIICIERLDEIKDEVAELKEMREELVIRMENICGEGYN